MPIPPFATNNWLPPGNHKTSWEEIEVTFRGNPNSQREKTFHRLLNWRDKARTLGVTGLLILNGSFISAKENPGDFDAVFIYDQEAENIIATNINAKRLIDYTICKETGFDLFACSPSGVESFKKLISLGLETPLNLFEFCKKTGERKGVVEVRI